MPSPLHRFPRKAILLAAGFGSRLAPLTREIPKPLLPLHGEPILGRTLRMLRDWGVTDVAVNLHHRADALLRDIPGLCPPGMRLALSFEPEILGTGGALRRLAWFPDPGQPFWLLNADVVMELDPAPLLRAARDSQALAVLWMVADAGPRTVRVEGQKVRDFRGGGLTFSGLHLVSPELLNFLPKEEVFSSVISAYEKAMGQGRDVLGVTVPDSVWADIGTPEQWLAAEGASIVMPGARVEEGAVLRKAVVGPRARLRRGRRVSGLVLAPDLGLNPEELSWLPAAEAVEFLPARGSDRLFRRVLLPRGSRLLMSWGSARPENDRFAAHTRYLARNGIRVPAIHAVSRDARTLLLEDAGTTHLLDAPSTAHTRKAVELAARFHALAGWQTRRLEPPFDAPLFLWEHGLFFKEFLSRHDASADPAPLRAAFAKAAQLLLDQPRVLLHRDLQSTNLLFLKGQAVLLDYQGMRAGPAAYDLASLFADPYLDRDPARQLLLLHSYNTLAKRPVSPEAYAAAVVQRLCQALGAYGRLGALAGTARFLQFVPPALRQIASWTSDPALQDWANRFLERQSRENTLGIPL